MNHLRSLMLVAVSIAVCCAGCGGSSDNDYVAEEWISRPATEWPQLVLTNEADFKGHTSLYGASGFLIRTERGDVLAGTATHLIGEDGGVEPEIPISELTPKIDSWKMYPRTKPEQFVSIVALGSQYLTDPQLDWLLLSVNQSDSLPSYPLKPRRKPVSAGDSVYLIGCPYNEPDCLQNVYAGVVVKRLSKRHFGFRFHPPVDLHGFSGAPIIDGKGYLVGLMNGLLRSDPEGDEFFEARGEDLPYARELWGN